MPPRRSQASTTSRSPSPPATGSGRCRRPTATSGSCSHAGRHPRRSPRAWGAPRRPRRPHRCRPGRARRRPAGAWRTRRARRRRRHRARRARPLPSSVPEVLMRVLLLSTYELGHQPLHVASPAGRCVRQATRSAALDLSVQPWDDAPSWPRTRSRRACRCTPRCAWRSPPRGGSAPATTGPAGRLLRPVRPGQPRQDGRPGRRPGDRRGVRAGAARPGWTASRAARRPPGTTCLVHARRHQPGSDSGTLRRPVSCCPTSDRYARASSTARNALAGYTRGEPRLRARVPPLPGPRGVRRSRHGWSTTKSCSPTSTSRSRPGPGTSPSATRLPERLASRPPVVTVLHDRHPTSPTT
jgi:hypothetical protein